MEMREILFRGKRVIDGKWVESCCPLGEMHSGTVTYDFDSKTVCQYTGLTDKNGKKIFENDICDRKEEFSEIVTYHDGDWTLDYSYASGKESGYNYCNLGFYVINRGGVEVIGNIFDNPELVKVE